MCVGGVTIMNCSQIRRVYGCLHKQPECASDFKSLLSLRFRACFLSSPDLSRKWRTVRRLLSDNVLISPTKINTAALSLCCWQRGVAKHSRARQISQKKQNPSIPLQHFLRSAKPRSDQNEALAIIQFFCCRLAKTLALSYMMVRALVLM